MRLPSLKLIAPVVGSVIGLLGLKLLDPQILPPETLSGWLRPLRGWAPLLFMLLLAVRPITLLPGQLLSGVGGVLFGTGPTIVYALLGNFLANGLLYLLARRFGGRLLRWWAGERIAMFDRLAERHAFHCALATCLNPFLPTDVMVAALGASGARFLPLVAGVMLGGAPSTVLTALYGGSVGRGDQTLAIVSGVGLILSLVLGAWLGIRFGRTLPDQRLSSAASSRAST